MVLLFVMGRGLVVVCEFCRVVKEIRFNVIIWVDFEI